MVVAVSGMIFVLQRAILITLLECCTPTRLCQKESAWDTTNPNDFCNSSRPAITVFCCANPPSRRDRDIISWAVQEVKKSCTAKLLKEKCESEKKNAACPTSVRRH